MLESDVEIRDFLPEDGPRAAAVFRDAYSTLKRSRGGQHSDKSVDALLQKPDAEVVRSLTRGGVLLVARVRGSGEIIGMHGFTSGLIDRILGSSYARNQYVREAYQKGKAGISVGRMLSVAAQERARKMGFRKWYGLSIPESVEYHKRYGWKHYPRHDTVSLDSGMRVHYIELELRKSALNGIRIEPYLLAAFRMIGRARMAMRKGI